MNMNMNMNMNKNHGGYIKNDANQHVPLHQFVMMMLPHNQQQNQTVERGERSDVG